MIKIKLILLLFILSKLSFSQIDNSNVPENIISVGFGLGPNHGLIGTKTVVGYKNSGLLIGLGTFNGVISYEIGAQLCPDWYYFNIGYGGFSVAYDGVVYEHYLMKGLILMGGGVINLGKRKLFYADLGIGYATGKAEMAYISVKKDVATINLGIGYRLIKR